MALYVPSYTFPSFFCISGPERILKTRIFEELKVLLPARFPELKFEFFSNPFSGLVHPLRWPLKIRRKHPTTRIFELWAPLNEATLGIARRVQSADPPDVVFVDGFGLNALLDATARVRDYLEADADVFKAHWEFVKLRLKDQGIPPPAYLLIDATLTQLRALSFQTHQIPFSELDVDGYNEKQLRMINAYFAPETGQRCIGKIPASYSIKEMTEVAIRNIAEHLRMEKEAPAAA